MERCRIHTFSETFDVGNCGDMIQHQDFKISCLFIFLCAFATLPVAIYICRKASCGLWTGFRILFSGFCAAAGRLCPDELISP